VDAVEALRGKAGDDLEVQARLREIMSTIKKREEMAKVFGPTKRTTAAFKQRRLAEVLDHLKTSLDEKIEGEGIDLDKKIDLELKGVTLWDALDALARAADLRYEYGYDKVIFRPGGRSDLPWKNVEQFRIGILELKRMEYRAPGRADSVGIIAIQVGHQRNMTPVEESGFGEGIDVDSVVDAAGKNLMMDRVAWSRSMSMGGHPFSKLRMVQVRPDDGPLTIEGKTRIRFESKRSEVSIPLAKGKREVRFGSFVFHLDEVVQTPDGMTMEIHVESDGEDPHGRLKHGSVAVVDAKGKRHEGETHSSGSSGTHINWKYTFPAGIVDGDRVVLRWITEFHLVEIPFRFDGVRIP
jgi:hypothetical protein